MDGKATPSNPEIERNFPTYKIGKEAIAVKEYEYAAQTAANEERIFNSTSNILALLIGVFASFAWGGLNKIFSNIILDQDKIYAATGVSLAALFLSYLALSHFGNMRRSYVYAARKVIVLRRMLGQSYGYAQLILPNWRLEGADIPYAIRMFPGWRARHLYPHYAIIFISTLIVWICILHGIPNSGIYVTYYNIEKSIVFFFSITSSIFILLCLTRRSMMDDNENIILLLSRLLAGALHVKLTGKYEYILYSARLARAELWRLNIDLEVLKKIAVFREDREFYTHSGFSIRASARAAIDWIQRRPSGGGSTIPQQLSRTLFIVRPRTTLRRKIIEIFLSMWISGRLTKDEVLEVYLASVRFENKIDGIAAAMKHFFGEIIHYPSPAQSFFLVERLANLKSSFRAKSIETWVKSAFDDGIMQASDCEEILDIYAAQISAGRVRQDLGNSPQDVKVSIISYMIAKRRTVLQPSSGAA